jgi:hypothetical protein
MRLPHAPLVKRPTHAPLVMRRLGLERYPQARNARRGREAPTPPTGVGRRRNGPGKARRGREAPTPPSGVGQRRNGLIRKYTEGAGRPPPPVRRGLAPDHRSGLDTIRIGAKPPTGVGRCRTLRRGSAPERHGYVVLPGLDSSGLRWLNITC